MSKSKLKLFGDKDVASWQKQVATRFGELVAEVGGRQSAAEIIGDVNLDTVSNWSTGKSKLPFYAACALCQATGRSPVWLATGLDQEMIHIGTIVGDDMMMQISSELSQYLDSLGIKSISPVAFHKLTTIIAKNVRDRIAHNQGGNVVNFKEFQDVIDLAVS